MREMCLTRRENSVYVHGLSNKWEKIGRATDIPKQYQGEE